MVEAVIALWSGERADSIALFGFGLDSVIEFSASGVVLWRYRVESAGGSVEAVEVAEKRAHRFIGGTFLALAAYVAANAGWTLWKAEAPQPSLPGILLATASLLVMPVLSVAKLRVASRLGSRLLRAEAKETLACSWLSLTLLLGLAANAWQGWWWADPVSAIAMVPWLVKEGLEGLRGEECACDE
ncbi:MAG: cation transporter [Planctomycetes bacterium]|nr:cation transporter [Planctomycetota bacterium]